MNLCCIVIGPTVGRTIIGSVNHQSLSLKLLIDEDSLWSGNNNNNIFLSENLNFYLHMHA